MTILGRSVDLSLHRAKTEKLAQRVFPRAQVVVSFFFAGSLCLPFFLLFSLFVCALQGERLNKMIGLSLHDRNLCIINLV